MNNANHEPYTIRITAMTHTQVVAKWLKLGVNISAWQIIY